MNKVLFSLLSLVLTLAGLRPAAAQTKDQQLVVALSAPGQPGTLHLKLVGGAIRVEGYNGREVIIDVAGHSGRDRGGDAEETSSGLRRIAKVNSLDVTAQEKGNHVYVRSQPGPQPLDFTIKVPRQFSLQLGTVNDGNITVDNVSGELEISNVNGSIRLTNVAGSAVLNTVNGEVTAKFTDVTPNVPMAFSSVNGKIDVTFPAKVRTALKLRSEHGDVYSDFDLTVDNTAPKTTRTAKDGTYRVSVDNWTYGKINGGTAEVMMKTLNGNIYIRKAK